MLYCFDWWHGGLEVTLEDDDAMLLCLMTQSFDGGLTWWCFGGLDDGGSCASLLYILPVSWSLPPLRVGSLKPLLVGSKGTLAGPSEELELLFSAGTERFAKIEVFHMPNCINGFYQWIMIEFSIYIWCTLSIWFIYCYALKIHECGTCFIRTGYKRLLGKILKFGKSDLTLIHPPSQCDCCVQHMKLNIVWSHGKISQYCLSAIVINALAIVILFHSHWIQSGSKDP